MNVPLRPFQIQLLGREGAKRIASVTSTIEGDHYVIRASDTANVFNHTVQVRIEQHEIDKLGAIALVQEMDTPLNFEWSLQIQPEYDPPPYLPDEVPYRAYGNVYFRNTSFTDKLNMDEAARKQLNIPKGVPVDDGQIVIYPLNHTLNLRFTRDGTFEHGDFY